MMKDKFERTKQHISIGTIGRIDHGRTTLTPALTKMMAELHGGEVKALDQIDKTPQERDRGIAITTAHVEYRKASGYGSRFHPATSTNAIAT
jgi:elongation factor Tu